MDVESDPTTTLHPYARMEDDGEDASSTDKLSHPSTSTEAPIVTVEVRDKSTLATEPYKCIMRHFLWCCSLRSGCIAVAVLYSIYAAVYVLGSVIVFIVIEPTTFSSKKPTERPLLGATIALYEAIIAIILIVLLSIGIRKDDTYYLHAAKWLMIFDCGLGFIENVQLAYMGYALMQVFHFCIQLIPVYFIFVVNSYEGELVSQQIIRQASFSQASVTHPS